MKYLILLVCLVGCSCGVYQEREVYVEETVMKPVKVHRKAKHYKAKPCEYVFCEPVILYREAL